MTYKQIVMAKNAIDELNKSSFPVQIAYQLYRLKKQVDEIFQFEVGLEKNLIEQYHGAVQSDGTITFQNKEDCARCTEGIMNVLNTGVDEKIKLINIPFSAVSDIRVSPEMIDRLDGFVRFVDGDNS